MNGSRGAGVWGDCLKCPRRSACDEIAMERAVPIDTRPSQAA